MPAKKEKVVKVSKCSELRKDMSAMLNRRKEKRLSLDEKKSLAEKHGVSKNTVNTQLYHVRKSMQ